MSSIPPPPASPDDQDARTQRHLAVLDTLIAHGLDLANRIHQQATCPSKPTSASAEPAAPPITPETIALFDQISRAVRRTILVSRKLAEPLPLAAPKPGPGPQNIDRVAARKRIIREVEDTIHRKPGANGDSLQAELLERVETVDLDDDIGHRPIHEIIAEICRDLGVAGDWDARRFKRRTPQDLQTLIARAARPINPAPHAPGPGAAKSRPPPDPAERHR